MPIQINGRITRIKVRANAGTAIRKL